MLSLYSPLEKPVFLYILILASKRKLVNVNKNLKNKPISRAINLSRQNSEALQKSANGKTKQNKTKPI